MSDLDSNLDLIESAQLQPATTANELYNAMSLGAIFGRRADACAGLTFGYYGGRIDGATVANGTVSATASNTNYVVVNRTTYAVTISTATTNWNDSANYGRMYKLTAGSGTITDYEDHRFSYDGTGIWNIGAGSGATLPIDLTTDVTGLLPTANIGIDADLDFDGNEGINAADPTTAQSLATRAYVDAGDSGASISVNAFHMNRRFEWQAVDGSATGDEFGSALGAPSAAGYGTQTAVSTATTNYYTSTTRQKGVCSASSGQSQGLRGNGLFGFVWRGNAAGLGGFKASFVGGVEVAGSNTRWFIGFRITATAPGNVEPSSFVDCIGIGCDAGETNLSIQSNDASGTATRSTLGANFPAQTSATDMYRLTLSAGPNASSIDYLVERLNTGHTASGTLSSDLPSNTALLVWQFWINNGSAAEAVAIAPSRVTITYGA